MMLSREPMDVFPNLQRHMFDKTKPVFGFGDLDPIFRVTGEFSQKIWMDFILSNTDILLEQAKSGIRLL